MTNIKRILVPVDYSECSRHALAFASQLAVLFNASLDIIHVWDKPTYVTDAVLVRRPGHEPRSLIELVKENAQHDMDEFFATITLPDSIVAIRRLTSGDPASYLIGELKKGEHDLVVMGTHGRTGFSHLMLGSVAEKLVQHSPVPVVTVPRPAAIKMAESTPRETNTQRLAGML
jgi:nucleotide-binding universal stress UspA family protein